MIKNFSVTKGNTTFLIPYLADVETKNDARERWDEGCEEIAAILEKYRQEEKEKNKCF